MKTVAILLGFLLLWLLLDRSATALGSFRGEWGVAIALLVVSAAVAVEGLAWRRRPADAARVLGLGRPRRGALFQSIVIAAALFCFFPAYALITATPMALRADWPLLLPGLFAQGGIAEEVVFRGYLFRHFREGRRFWRAALISAVPFTAVHLTLFLSLDFAVALTSLLVALSLTFPLAWLFERAGNSIWPPAILHFAVQAPIKLVDVAEGAMLPLAICWMILGASVPWLLFLWRRPAEGHRPHRP